ncbi:MAG: hypothetical protein II098_04575 [Treponema sp.]|nr:hypothetical protein [Treponema sp.]
MANEKWYDQFSKKKNSKISEAKNKRKEFNRQRDAYFDAKRRGTEKTAGDVFCAGLKRTDAEITAARNLFDAKTIPADAIEVLNNFDQIVQGVKPMNSRQLQNLPKDIRTLSHQLTDERESRHVSYMNATEQLSAYLRYFTWWNLVRLTRVFSNLPEGALKLSDGDVVLDIGSGPLTVVIALWLARPDLRSKKLTVYCMDISQSTMATGEDLYMSVAARALPSTAEAESFWKIIRVKGEIGTPIRKKARFVTCANMFNELYQKEHEDPEKIADRQFKRLVDYAEPEAAVFIAEPGMPAAGRFISIMRERFIAAGYNVPAPCPHLKKCPMNGLHARYGGSAKWCNFSFSTEDAPSKLLKLSESAGLPKDRAVISFLFAENMNRTAAGRNENQDRIAVVSDPIMLPGRRQGFYSCCAHGMVLAIDGRNRNLKSGDILTIKIGKDFDSLPKDKKSGAMELNF